MSPVCTSAAASTPRTAIRRLTPLPGQHAPARYIALAARLEGFTRADLEGGDHRGRGREDDDHAPHRCTSQRPPTSSAYAQLTRQARMRTWRTGVRAPRRGGGSSPSWARGLR
jgi:hypothetical protein